MLPRESISLRAAIDLGRQTTLQSRRRRLRNNDPTC